MPPTMTRANEPASEPAADVAKCYACENIAMEGAPCKVCGDTGRAPSPAAKCETCGGEKLSVLGCYIPCPDCSPAPSKPEGVMRYVVTHDDAYALANGVPGTSDDFQDVYVLASSYDAKCAEVEILRQSNPNMAAIVDRLRQIDDADWQKHREQEATIATLKAEVEAAARRSENIAESLNADIATLQSQLAEAQRALRKYGWHDIKVCDACNTNGVRFTDMDCTCGFDAALSSADGGGK